MANKLKIGKGQRFIPHWYGEWTCRKKRLAEYSAAVFYTVGA